MIREIVITTGSVLAAFIILDAFKFVIKKLVVKNKK